MRVAALAVIASCTPTWSLSETDLLFDRILIGNIAVNLGEITPGQVKAAFGQLDTDEGQSQRLCYTSGKFVVWFPVDGDEPINAVGFELFDGKPLNGCAASRVPFRSIKLDAPAVGDSVATIDAEFGAVAPDENGNIRLATTATTAAGKVTQTLVYAVANAKIVGLAAIQQGVIAGGGGEETP